MRSAWLRRSPLAQRAPEVAAGDMSRPVMVTGAAGFIGTHLTRTLAVRGESVRAVDLEPDPHRFRLETVRYARADIRDTAALEPLLDGVDTVYHLASAHLQVNAEESTYREVNVDAAERLVRACARVGVRRLVHASSVGIYGHVAHPPACEDAPTAPGNMYERTKLEGETAVRKAAAEVGLELIVLRPAWVYGPGCPRMKKLLRSVKSGRFIYVGEGRNLRHPLYVSDAVEAFILAATASARLSGRAYLIAGPRYVELRELVEICARVQGVAAPRLRLPRQLMLALGRAAEITWGAAGREPPFSRRSLVFFENDNAFDTTAARRELGFEPTIDVEEGVRRTVRDHLRLIGT
jgi:dihydroflavonol-4-reductase